MFDIGRILNIEEIRRIEKSKNNWKINALVKNCSLNIWKRFYKKKILNTYSFLQGQWYKNSLKHSDQRALNTFGVLIHL